MQLQVIRVTFGQNDGYKFSNPKGGKNKSKTPGFKIQQVKKKESKTSFCKREV